VNPNPKREIAVRIHDMSVDSTARRVRNQEKWLSDVGRTSNLGSAPSTAVTGPVMLEPFFFVHLLSHKDMIS
jgi:hypothetical protein